MPRFIFVIALFASCLAAPAQAGVVVTVDKTVQRLTVEVDGVVRHTFPVSTARRGYHTPNGSYRPQWLARKWYSIKYDGSPMPYSIFFYKGFAIHGSYEIAHLGSPASHGCIRLHPDNAAVLFALVQPNVKDTQIIVTGEGAPARSEGSRRSRPAVRQRAPAFDGGPGGSLMRNPAEY